MASLENENPVPAYVYAQTAESLQLRGIYKIGWTKEHPSVRARKLSVGTGVPEEFHVSFAVRCESPDDAQKLEKWVKSELDRLGVRWDKNRGRREFYKVENLLGLMGCFSDGARHLGLRVIPDAPRDIVDIADSAESILSENSLELLNSDVKKIYYRGAKDLAGLLFIALVKEKMSQVVNQIYSELGDSVIQPQPRDLPEAVESALHFIFGKEVARNFKEQVSDFRRSDRENELMGDTEAFADWRDFIQTDPNWPREEQ